LSLKLIQHEDFTNRIHDFRYQCVALFHVNFYQFRDRLFDGLVNMTDVFMRVVPGGLMACNQVEADKLEKLRGKEVKCKITQPRNLKFLKKYFALLGSAFDFVGDEDMTMEQFRTICTVGAGWADFFPDPKTGTLIAVPKSIAFPNMDETEFVQLYSDTITFICGRWVVNQEQLEEVARFI